MLNSFLLKQEDLEQDNGHFSVLVQRKSGILSVKIVHKVNGTIWRKRWCWNSQKADIQFSVLQVHCPEVGSKAKAMENCRCTIMPIWKRFKLFFAQLLLLISSVFTEESQKCVKNMQPVMIERRDPLWVNIVAVSDHVFHRFPSDLLIQVSATQLSLFLCVPFVLMATDRACEDAMRTSLPRSHRYLRMMILVMVLVTTSMEWMGTRSGNTMDEKLNALLSKFAHSETQIAQIPALTTWMSRMDSHISKTLGDFATRLTEMEQNFSALTARMCKFETHAASASNVSGSARSWPTLEQVDGSTAAGSHGPGSSDDNRNTRRRLDPPSNTEDEQSRSAVLLRFPCEQYHKGITKWIDNLWEESSMPAYDKPVRIHCKAGSVSFRLVFATRGKCQDTICRKKMLVCPMLLTVPSAAPMLQSQCVNPNQLKTESLENNLRLCGENWLTNSNFSSLMEMTKVHSSSERSMLVHNFSAFKIEETELENQCSNLPLLEVDTHLPLLHLSCLFLVVLLKCCNVFSLKPTRPMCVGRPFASPLFRRLAGRGAFFCGFPFRWVLRFVLT